MADFVAVMYAGQIVESGPALDVLRWPRHRYTEALLQAAPKISGRGPSRLPEIPGQPPSMAGDSVGCRFRDRCAFQQADCAEGDLPLMPAETGGESRCLHPPSVASQTRAAADA
jgi:oligopeptide/dipeptide ABC transporter ATP-binding protein